MVKFVCVCVCVCVVIIIIIIIIHEYYYGGTVALLLQDHLTMSMCVCVCVVRVRTWIAAWITPMQVYCHMTLTMTSHWFCSMKVISNTRYYVYFCRSADFVFLVLHIFAALT